MSKTWKLIITIIAILAVIAVIALLLTGYFNFISTQIESDSERHLTEIYEQVNNSFQGFLERNWNFLKSCNDYYLLLKQQGLNDDALTQQMKQFLDDSNVSTTDATSPFEDFFFLDEEQKYRTLNGREGDFAPDDGSLSPMQALISDKKNILAREHVDKKGGSGEDVIMFAIAAKAANDSNDPEQLEFNGFPFTAIGVSYTADSLAVALNANAFLDDSDNSLAKCYIMSPDGEVLLSTSEGTSTFNYLTFMSNLLGKGELESLRRGIKNISEDNKGHGYLAYSLPDDFTETTEERCIVFMPIGYENYILLSDVPQQIVSQGFLQAQRATMRVLLITFSLVIAAILVVMIARIISQSKQSKQELLYREKMFDVLSSTVNDIFLMLDPKKQKLDYISPNIERLLGIKVKTAKENIRTIASCAVDYNIIVPNDELQSIPIGGNRNWECEYMHQTTGERRWYRVMIYHMNIQNMEKYIVVMSDRTLDKQLTAQLEEALNAAKSANEAKSNFLSNMSHDIRTPMNAIVGFSVLLERNAENRDKVREYTRKIMASSHHLLSLINDVLDMSKIESGKTSLNVERFSLPDLLEELNIIIMPQAKAKEQDFTIRVHGTPPDELMGDRLRLNQILINLLSNAVKYTPDGGKIEFTVREIEESSQFTKLRFIVKDNGIGMSEDYLQDIFKPFSRETNSVVNKIQGTGLGMAITKNLVDLMGGIIEVESEPGKGSTFTVELSLALVQEKTQDAWFCDKITRMLVADDEEEICLNIREMMRETGVDVSYVTDGESAVRVAVNAHEHKSDFNVILLDWKMPGMDGVETARRIRESVGAHVPILVLTSYDWSDIETEAREAGINAFMPKPFFTSTFFQTIKPLFATEQPIPVQPENDESADDALKGKLLLVAEDNELNAEILTEMLDMEGARCEVAKNGKVALEMFLRSDPGYYDLILMDVQMPLMNGYEATKAIRTSEHPDATSIPIVAMTANTFAEDVQTALNSGMDAHLAKPIDMDVVRKTVAQLFENHLKGDLK